MLEDLLLEDVFLHAVDPLRGDKEKKIKMLNKIYLKVTGTTLKKNAGIAKLCDFHFLGCTGLIRRKKMTTCMFLLHPFHPMNYFLFSFHHGFITLSFGTRVFIFFKILFIYS